MEVIHCNEITCNSPFEEQEHDKLPKLQPGIDKQKNDHLVRSKKGLLPTIQTP